MQFFLSFLAVLSLALLLVVRFRINAAVAPFMSVAGILLTCVLLGMINLFYPAVILVFALAVLAPVYLFAVRKEKLRDAARAFFQPGMVFFIVSFVFFFVVMTIQHPAFRFWDEFSFWGTAAKTLFEHKQLYTLFPSSMINTSYPPGLPVWSCFLQFFGRTFSEWGVYFAYDVLMMSVMSALFARVRWKNWLLTPLLAFFSVFGLYTFWYSMEGSYAYYTSYADVAVGFVFAAVLLVWFSSDGPDTGRYAAAVMVLALLPLIKDMGFAFGLVAAMIIACDMIIARSYPGEPLKRSRRRALLRCLYVFALFAAVLVVYELWSLHFSLSTSLSRAPKVYEYSLLQMLSGQDEYFNAVVAKMLSTLRVTMLTTFGTMDVMLWVFTLVPIAVAACSRTWRTFARVAVASVLLLLGFAAYYAFMAYAYAAIFAHSAVLDLVSFERYVSSYPIGWYYVAGALCLLVCGNSRLKKLPFAPAFAVFAAAVLSIFHFSVVPLDQYVLTSPKLVVQQDELRTVLQGQAARFAGAFTNDDRLYYVCQSSDGGEWFVFNYEFLPAYTVKTFGGGNFVPLDSTAQGAYDKPAGIAEFTQYLLEQDVDYVYLQKLDDYFYSQFAPMFTDNLAGFYDGTCYMYKVVRNSDGSLSLVPTYGTESVANLRQQYGY